MKRTENKQHPASRKNGATSAAASPRSRRWLFRLLAMTLVPLLFLAGLEMALRLAGYGYNPDYFLPLRIGDEDYLVQNEDFSRRFFPGDVSRQPAAIRMKAHKPPGALRIFVLGESAAMGDPEPAFGPARYLEVLLRERHPHQEIEIINVAFTAINSHVILPLARECAQRDGDIWIVYMGNNEMVGPFGAATVFGLQSPPLPYIRATLAVQRTRLGQLGHNLLRRFQKSSAPAASWGGMQMFLENRVSPDSPKRIAAYRNFAGNLRDILNVGVDSGARVLLNTVAVNLRESPPFASWVNEALPATDRARFDSLLAEAQQDIAATNWTGAVTRLRQAVELDAQHAGAEYQLAIALEQIGDRDGAQKYFQLACDHDALPFRTDAPLNAAIRQAAGAQGSQVQLLEADTAMAAAGGRLPPGNESFYEHVHFNFDGAYRLGLGWAEAVEHMAAPLLDPPAAGWPAQSRCDALLGLTDWNRKLVIESVVRRLQQPPLSSQPNNPARIQRLETQGQMLLAGMTRVAADAAETVYTNAIAARPDDHFLREVHGNFLQVTGDRKGAIREWRAVADLMPHDFLPWFQLGVLLAREGQHAEAEKHFRAALMRRPALVEGWMELARSLGAAQQWEPALEALRRARALRPGDAVLAAQEAKVLVELGRRSEAIVHYQRAVALRPDYWEARAALGGLLAQSGKTAEAVVQYEAAIKAKPDFAMAHFNLGVLRVRQGQLSAAIEAFETAQRLEPDNQTTAESLERTREQRGQQR